MQKRFRRQSGAFPASGPETLQKLPRHAADKFIGYLHICSRADRFKLLISRKSVNTGRKADAPRSGVSQPKTTLSG
jgi:hypothetical protein